MSELKMKGIIVYGTSFGATKGTAEEIARILREENFDIKLVNAQEEKVKDISECNLVIVGSSVITGGGFIIGFILRIIGGVSAFREPKMQASKPAITTT